MNIGFWAFMLIMVMLVPAGMLFFGRMFIKNAPKDINYVFGYRTKMSMINKDTWQFAHKHCGKLWKRAGQIMFPVSAVTMLLCFGRSIDTVGIVGAVLSGVQVLLLILATLTTQMALKKTFDTNGRRK